MSGKIFGSFITGIFVAVLIFQVASASAHVKDKPVTGPVTSPITSATDCKFGWGFGDKNHCHYGPWGWVKKHVSFSFFNHHENNKNNNNKHH